MVDIFLNDDVNEETFISLASIKEAFGQWRCFNASFWSGVFGADDLFDVVASGFISEFAGDFFSDFF